MFDRTDEEQARLDRRWPAGFGCGRVGGEGEGGDVTSSCSSGVLGNWRPTWRPTAARPGAAKQPGPGRKTRVSLLRS